MEMCRKRRKIVSIFSEIMKAVELFEIQRLTLRRRGSKLYVYVQRDKLYEDILKSLEKEFKKKIFYSLFLCSPEP